MHPKFSKSLLGLDIAKKHDFPKIHLKKSLHRISQSQPILS
jgi:hypothetical protein